MDDDPDIVRLRSLPYFGKACAVLRYGLLPNDDPYFVRLRSLPYFGQSRVVLRYRPPFARGVTEFRILCGCHWEPVPAREVALVVAALIALAERDPEKVQDCTGFSLEKLLQSRDELKRIVSRLEWSFPPDFSTCR